MDKQLNPDKMKIGYVILVSTRKFAVEKLQLKGSYGDSSKRTHVAGILGRYTVQFFWFPISLICGKIVIVLHNLFSSRKRFLYSELIATGFYKEGDFLFDKPAANLLPADFDNSALFEEIKDIWLSL
jgi:hypothetical protein